MTTLKEKIDADLKQAMRDRDKLKLSVLRMLTTSFTNARIQAGEELDDKAVLGLVRKAIKQRQDAASQYRNGNRPELAEKEEQEAVILESYMPEQIGEDELREAIKALIAEQGLEGPKAMGVVMKAMMARFSGTADGSVISRIAKELLS